MRLIDARYIINRITEERREWGDDYDVEQVLGDIEDAPTIDAVQVVRCKDCEYFSEPNSFSGKCTLRGDYIFKNDFCSYAVERRTDERSD